MNELKVNEYVNKLRKAGLKTTPQRIEIVKVLTELGKEHPSLNRVFKVVKDRVPTISFSTLYMTLRKLEKLELIRLFD